MVPSSGDVSVARHGCAGMFQAYHIRANPPIASTVITAPNIRWVRLALRARASAALREANPWVRVGSGRWAVDGVLWLIATSLVCIDGWVSVGCPDPFGVLRQELPLP